MILDIYNRPIEGGLEYLFMLGEEKDYPIGDMTAMCMPEFCAVHARTYFPNKEKLEQYKKDVLEVANYIRDELKYELIIIYRCTPGGVELTKEIVSMGKFEIFKAKNTYGSPNDIYVIPLIEISEEQRERLNKEL